MKATITTLLLVMAVHFFVGTAWVIREMQGTYFYYDRTPLSWPQLIVEVGLLILCLWLPFRWFPWQAMLGVLIGLGAAVIFHHNHFDTSYRDWEEDCFFAQIGYDLVALAAVSPSFILPAVFGSLTGRSVGKHKETA